MSFPLSVQIADGMQYVVDQTKQFPVGTRGVGALEGDTRVWRYTYLGATTISGGYGGVSGGKGVFPKVKGATVTIVTAIEGSQKLSATVTDMTADRYKGGLLTIYESGKSIVSMGVVSNLATGVTDNITLDGKLPDTFTSSATAFIVEGSYSEVVIPGTSTSAGSPYAPCVGIFNSPEDKDGTDAAAGDYCWVQTWGPCFCWASGTYEGGNGPEREVVMMGDGAAQVLTDALVETHACYQHIGHLYPDTGDLTTTMNNPSPTDGTDPSLMENVIFLRIAP